MKFQSVHLIIGLGLLFIFCHNPLISQKNFQRVDSIALEFKEPIKSVVDLVQQLTLNIETDIEKARVFYMWISKNIRYDCRKFHNNKPTKVDLPVLDFKEQTKSVTWKIIMANIRDDAMLPIDHKSHLPQTIALFIKSKLPFNFI